MNPDPIVAPTPSSASSPKPPVIRQVALVMLVLCLLLPLLLVLRKPQATARDHDPAKTRAAMSALFSAIVPAAEPLAVLPDASALTALLPSCRGLKNYQGLPAMEDLAEQIALLQHLVAGQTAVEGVHNAPLRKKYQLDVATWAKAINTGKIECEHAVQALRTLAGPRGNALLAQARWAEHQFKAAQPNNPGAPAVTMATRSLSQGDPWRGWPGCIWIGGLQSGGPLHYVSPAGRTTWGRQLCEQTDLLPVRGIEASPAQPAPAGSTPPVGDPAWAIPKDLGTIVSELESLRRPESALYENYAATRQDGANRRTIGRNVVDVGFNLHLTIDPRAQAAAQQVAECYAGNKQSCRLAGIDFTKVGAAQNGGARFMWEQAAIRMTAIAIMDVGTGRIEALASAHTPCFAQENDGPFRDAGCPGLWTRPQRRPDALLNHAAFTDYMPGSTVKPILASVFFEDAPSNADQIGLWLAKSDTNHFNDELFCLNSPVAKDCDRPRRVQQRAADLGWNADCSGQPSFRCARGDMLFGRRLSAQLDTQPTGGAGSPLQRPFLSGRMLAAPFASESGNAYRLMPIPAIGRAAAMSCRPGGKWGANNCNTAALKPLVNEAAGQGDARATALSMAGMLSRLVGAANGLEQVRRPYIVETVTDARGKSVATAATRVEGDAAPLAQAEPINIKPEVAKKVLAGLAKGTLQLPGQDGTGHLICKHVFGARCGEAGTRLAGKTGTPSFSFDMLTLDGAARICKARPRDEDCSEKPIKWYVAAYRSQPGAGTGYDKVIAVMSERNWYGTGKDVPQAVRGRIHGLRNDLNNVSTEIAMHTLDLQWKRAAK